MDRSLGALWVLVEANDRRYTELDSARMLALQEKDAARERALLLARQAQDYKDEKANQLREQIYEERGFYATRADLGSFVQRYEAAHKPIADFVTAQVAASGERREGITFVQSLVGTLATVSILLVGILSYAQLHKSPTQHPTITVTIPSATP